MHFWVNLCVLGRLLSLIRISSCELCCMIMNCKYMFGQVLLAAVDICLLNYLLRGSWKRVLFIKYRFIDGDVTVMLYSWKGGDSV